MCGSLCHTQPERSDTAITPLMIGHRDHTYDEIGFARDIAYVLLDFQAGAERESQPVHGILLPSRERFVGGKLDRDPDIATGITGSKSDCLCIVRERITIIKCCSIEIERTLHGIRFVGIYRPVAPVERHEILCDRLARHTGQQHGQNQYDA